jgi:predicted DNA-binding antitoxin AbrB/MazE fold protein
MKNFRLVCLLALSINIMSAPEGAFNTLMVKAKDVNGYINFMKENPEVFKTIGSDVAGVCVTSLGNDYPGQMFVWNAFPSIEKAFAASDLYDPMNTSSDFKQLRTVMYAATFKPLKDFELRPGSERLWRIKLNNWQKYVEKMTELEKALNDAGHDIRIGVFSPIGGGSAETGMFHLRAVGNSSAETGAAIDDYFSGASWGRVWDASQEYVDEVVNETLENCQIVYTAE